MKTGNQEVKTSELESLYQSMHKRIKNGYAKIEQEHGQFEYDKLDLLNETFCVLHEKNLHEKKGNDLKYLAWKTFTNLKKNYYRKFVKPQRSDSCFVEFSTEKMVMFDEVNADQNYYDTEYINRCHYIKVIIRALKNNEKKLFSLYHCREVKQVDIASRLNIANVSLSIKRLNKKIMLICKKHKIDSVIDTRFAIPSWKPEKIAMTQSYWTAPSAAPANIRKLESAKSNNGKWFENRLETFENTFECPTKVKEIESIPYKRNVKQSGFFGNAVNGKRLLDLLNSENLIYGSDSFNCFYSKKSIFSSF